jgi:acetyl esterase/lipase
LGLAYGPDASQVLDLYLRKDPTKKIRSTIVLAHGGLWYSGGRDNLAALCSNIVSHSNGTFACASIDYRLSQDLGGECTGTGKATYLDQVSDMALAYGWLQQNAEDYAINPHRMFIGGHSAGGHLAQVLNLRWKEFNRACEGDQPCPAPLGAIGLEGIYNIPAWDEYDRSFWEGRFECATRKAFGAPGPSPAACLDPGTDKRCWDMGSPAWLTENAGELGIKPVADVLLVHSTGDNWVDIAEAENLGRQMQKAYSEIDVLVKTDGSCASSQHNDMLSEAALALCIIEFVSGRRMP